MKKRFLALALGTLAFGVTLGGVKMGLGHQDALMVKAAEGETLLTSLTFSNDTNSDSIGSYTICGLQLPVAITFLILRILTII